jgi:hypothetical protein
VIECARRHDTDSISLQVQKAADKAAEDIDWDEEDDIEAVEEGEGELI